MSLIDISRTLKPGMVVWPGDTPYQLTEILALRDGASVNLTTLTLSAHTGSHVDAPWHFAASGQTIEALDLARYWGPAQVITVQKRAGPLSPADLAAYDLRRAERLLVRSGASVSDPDRFPVEYVYPGPDLADYLGGLGIILYGTDAPSMDHVDSQTMDGHHALHRNGIAILEGLDLSAVPDGRYELVALPLKIAGGDGSPVRAVLRTLAE
jgi:arylformamidase